MKLRCWLLPITSPLPSCRANLLHPRSISPARTFFSHPFSVRLTPPFIPSFSFSPESTTPGLFFPLWPCFHFFPPDCLTSSLIPPLLFLPHLSSTLLFPFNLSVVISKLIGLLFFLPLVPLFLSVFLSSCWLYYKSEDCGHGNDTRAYQ